MEYNNSKLPDEYDDNIGYDAFSKFLDEDTLRKKNRTAIEFSEIGEICLTEIDRKKKNQSKLKLKYVPYILKHSDNYNVNELESYELNDIIIIYNELKIENQSKFKKFIHFYPL